MTTLKERIDHLSSGDSILILGFGVTGKALAEFFEKQKIGYYFAEDTKKVSWEGTYYRGQMSGDIQDEILKEKIKIFIPSPGVPLTNPIIQKALKAEIPIYGELELASSFLRGEFIAVTGTNGKSTTVKLINHLLEDAGIPASLKGNIGFPLITAVNEPPKSYYVVEESSYQLERIGLMKHHIAICLNVSDDHLDHHSSFEDYVSAKANIIKNSGKDDYFIYNGDDDKCMRMSWSQKGKSCKSLPFSLVQTHDEGAFAQGDDLIVRLESREFRFHLSECALRGMHNMENMLAALTAALIVDSSPKAVLSYKKTLREFKGLPHRLEKVGTIDGVDYYDDSKGTNVGAVVMSLASFHNPVVLIAGGRDKGGDYGPLKGLVKSKVKRLILLGEAKEKMFRALEGTTEITCVSDMKEAVDLAFCTAKPGDVVLLSPACSSFDQYTNFVDRGKDFQKHVKAKYSQS